MTVKDLCMEHSGICVGVADVKTDIIDIKKEQITIRESIVELKIFMSKLVGGATVVALVMDKWFLK